MKQIPKKIITMLFVVFFVCSMPIEKREKKIALKFGHRGASFDAPENTLASVRKAFELGADGVEIDVQMTADKKVVVLHDDTLKRTATYTHDLKEKTGMSREMFEKIVNTPICQLNYDEFKYIDVGLWKGKVWSKERVPTLDEVLRIVFFAKKPGKKVQIEIKGKNLAIIPELKKILFRYPKSTFAASVMLIGFDFETMEVAKKEIADCCVLLLRELKQIPMLNDVKKSIDEMVTAGLDGLGFEANQKLVSQEIVERVHQKSKIIGVWVYPEQDTWENLEYFQKLGVDFITTNLPPQAVKGRISVPLNSGM